MIGVARMACAITMAEGVKSSSRKPNGPERDSAKYSTRPTTTGGNPNNALINMTNNLRPRNGKMASAVPSGKLSNVAIAVAAKLTPSESATISRNCRKWLYVSGARIRIPGECHSAFCPRLPFPTGATDSALIPARVLDGFGESLRIAGQRCWTGYRTHQRRRLLGQGPNWHESAGKKRRLCRFAPRLEVFR